MNLSAVGFNLSWILSGLLLIPYLVWGVYLLRRQLRDHVELSPMVEACTIAALIVFFMFEVTLLKVWMTNAPLKYWLAMFGLILSGAALYGPLVLSFTSHMLVDLVMPTGRGETQEPRYGAAEAFERTGEFEAAAHEYETVARMFPTEAKAALRAADNYMKLGEPEEALPWFEQGLANTHDPEHGLPIVNRLFEIYARKLERPEEGRRVLEGFLERHGEASEYGEIVKKRLARLQEGPAGGIIRPGSGPGSPDSGLRVGE